MIMIHGTTLVFSFNLFLHEEHKINQARVSHHPPMHHQLKACYGRIDGPVGGC
jgi:hypothetical protein